jgi:uncharacterized protein YodC (DUF2158 family)
MIQQLEKEDSDMTNSDSNAEEASHFQFKDEEPSTGFQMIQLEEGCNKALIQEVTLHNVSGAPFDEAMVPRQVFEKRNPEVLFEPNHGKKIKSDLKNVTSLDRQSTMDLFCNPKLVNNMTKTSNDVRLKSNGRTMTVNHKATRMNGCNGDAWFMKDATTNAVVALGDLIKQCPVTRDSNDQMFVVSRESQNKPNTCFQMHESGLHNFFLQNEALVFVNTVSGIEEGFSQKQIKGAESAKSLHAKLGHPSIKDLKWVIQSNQISDCPTTV